MEGKIRKWLGRFWVSENIKKGLSIEEITYMDGPPFKEYKKNLKKSKAALHLISF